MNSNLRLRLYIALSVTLALGVIEATAQIPIAPSALRTDSKETQSDRPLAPMSVLAFHIRNDIETDFSAAKRLRYLAYTGRFASSARYYDALQAYLESGDRGGEFLGMLQFTPTLANIEAMPYHSLSEYYLKSPPGRASRLTKLLAGNDNDTSHYTLMALLVRCGRKEHAVELVNNRLDREMRDLGFGHDWRTQLHDVEKWPTDLLPERVMDVGYKHAWLSAQFFILSGYHADSQKLISPFHPVFDRYHFDDAFTRCEILLQRAAWTGDRKEYAQMLKLLREKIAEYKSLPIPSKQDGKVLEELGSVGNMLTTQQRTALRASPELYNNLIIERQRRRAEAGDMGYRYWKENQYHLLFRNWHGISASRKTILAYSRWISWVGDSGWASETLLPTGSINAISHVRLSPKWYDARFSSLPLADPRLTDLGLEVAVKSRVEIVDSMRQFGARSLPPAAVRLQGVAAAYRHLAFPPVDADVHQLSVDWLAYQTAMKVEYADDRKEVEARMRRYRETGKHPAGYGPGLPPVRLKALQDKLREDEAFFEIVRVHPFDTRPETLGIRFTPARYLGWLVKSSGEPSFYDLGLADELDHKIGDCRDEFQQSLQTIEKIGEVAATKRVQKRLHDLATQVLHPLADDLRGVEYLTICPDGELWLVPWAALPLPSGKPLAEELTVSHRFSIGELLTKRPPVKGTASGAVVFSNPNFEATPQRIADAERSLPGGRWKSDEEIIRPELHVSMTALEPFDRKDLPFSPAPGAVRLLSQVASLPGTVKEAQRVTPSLEVMTDTKPTVYEGDAANEAALQNVRRPEYLILQTHGFFLPKPEEPTQAISAAAKAAEWGGLHFGHWPQGYRSLGLERSFARCGLLLAGLAGANEANAWGFARSADGIVSALEVAMMDLRGTKMVVLSACDTGIGDVRVGEGVTSLCQAFQMAGAESVVSSLWQVEDESTADIMADFFEELSEGQLRHVALRNAQLRQIKKQREKHGVAHPYFWAAFTLTGETGVDRPMKK